VDIEKRFGGFHLQMRFETEASVLGLLGASGSGKSLTLKCIAGIERPDRGRILLEGRCLFDSENGIDLPPQKRRVGYLFENYALFPHMTVLENLRAACRARGADKSAIEETLLKMRLSGLENMKPHQLSTGQKQRLALGRILLNRPELILLDEPFSALDSHLRFQLEAELRSLCRDFPGKVLLVSHDREELFRLSQEIAIVKDGQIETMGEKRAVFSAPISRNGALLTGYNNILELEKSPGGRVFLKGWDLELTALPGFKEADFAGIHPGALQLAKPGEGVPCRVLEVLEGSFKDVLLVQKYENEHPAPLRLYVPERSAWKNGDLLFLHFPLEALLPLKD